AVPAWRTSRAGRSAGCRLSHHRARHSDGQSLGRSADAVGLLAGPRLTQPVVLPLLGIMLVGGCRFSGSKRTFYECPDCVLARGRPFSITLMRLAVDALREVSPDMPGEDGQRWSGRALAAVLAAVLACSALWGTACTVVVVLRPHSVVLDAGLAVSVALGFSLMGLWLCSVLRIGRTGWG